MALIECFECGNQVSNAAATCPKCGVAIAVNIQPNTVSIEEVEKPAGILKKFLNAKLLTQILITALMWVVAALLFYAFKNNDDSLLTPIFWVIGIASLVRGAQGFTNMKKSQEKRMSEVDIIARGVSKGKSPMAHDMGELIAVFFFAGFWFIAYFLIAGSSVVLAPVMTLFVAYKAVKSSK
jgi:fatty acid desaturase